ncbi:acyclic terpene utilization AtuA family protein [Hydrogenophaga sp. 2FB]|uniref:acyclic terpene utilization AtuA family protein n=1 Tax=Hydrogenophaga sp. 2FB TaxID=2502187 RepID=UPI0010F4487D|nr:acyclic terpene utilization AtuA family protein [Hydrogenophaga sp. 2FB]
MTVTPRSRRDRALRIGCASGFWGDSEAGAAQLVQHGQIDYLVFDYLAEITMSLLARARAKSPEAGYAPDFVKVIAQLAPQLQAQGIRVVANAGGVNPQACASALNAALQAQGIAMHIAVVEGDDLSDQADALRAAETREMFSGEPMPARLLSVNAYLGAQPIAAALDAGAQIVITGRVVDSAVTLGPLVHEFGWDWNDWDKLATGSLAGHIIECGTQCTGGLYTDWQAVPGWDNMGFPIAECAPDGRSVVITKPAGTGGLVIPGTVAEQIVYEIADPRRYLLPDVVCDFSDVRLAQEGEDRVRVSGARGTPAPAHYKVSATWSDGWRLLGTLMIGGHEAAAKASRVGEAILQRCTRLLGERGLPGFSETSLEVLGAESTYGPHARTRHSREVILKLAAKHPQREALELLAREIAPSATAMAQGITGFAAGRPSPSPVVRLFSFLIAQSRVAPRVSMDGQPLALAPHPLTAHDHAAASAPAADAPSAAALAGPTARVPLLRLAHGRSGDKGDSSNVGIIARSPAAYAELRRVLGANEVANYFSHVAQGPVTRYELPGFLALNFVLERALGGGGVASLRYDPQGKAFAQMLLDLEVEIPTSVLDTLP